MLPVFVATFGTNGLFCEYLDPFQCSGIIHSFRPLINRGNISSTFHRQMLVCFRITDLVKIGRVFLHGYVVVTFDTATDWWHINLPRFRFAMPMWTDVWHICLDNYPGYLSDQTDRFRRPRTFSSSDYDKLQTLQSKEKHVNLHTCFIRKIKREK